MENWRISPFLGSAQLQCKDMTMGLSFVADGFWIIKRFWETAHLPLSLANINTYLSLREKCWSGVGVGWGVGGRCAVSQKRIMIDREGGAANFFPKTVVPWYCSAENRPSLRSATSEWPMIGPFSRLQVVPHFFSGIVERAKGERA